MTIVMNHAAENAAAPDRDPSPTREARRRGPGPRFRTRLVDAAWWLASLLIFAGIWEVLWAIGVAPELTLPPPHIFLSNFLDQARYFANASTPGTPSPVEAVLSAVGATVGRVLAGLLIGFVASLATGILITQFRVGQRLIQPMVTLLAPISPIAWLPISIFVFGVGNGPAVFMVFIGVYFMMTLSTIADINGVSSTYRNVARTLGATRRQLLFQVILPAILPSLFRTLRLNLFAAWMTVLVAEAVGVGQGLGQVVMLARNTFNSSLVFFAMTVIGVAGYLLDILFRWIQNSILWWTPSAGGR